MLFRSHSPEITKKFAWYFAETTLRYRSRKGAFVVGLKGELGAGKTTFIQGFARGLRIKNKITSPTFLLIRNHELRIRNYEKLYHIDAYRIKKPKELAVLGLKEILTNPRNIVLIEWAEKIKRVLPKQMIWINFEHSLYENERLIKLGFLKV